MYPIKIKGGVIFTFGDLEDLSALWSPQKKGLLLKSEAPLHIYKILWTQTFSVLKLP